uniref:Uncharacterized protein n=1 Tax=Candidatus Kentrum sp. LPFa TaxID=2126335 RepID=A0A450XC62_9GAMM|nr:MAG: hypothetical protein BECKLPF1236A_GA0070988_105511 [Candidatus Kentron sp. LPFa]VFK36135.1 MAG: hypothetical protein BECKLPF1236C_GA0070990_104942 [Candidatus Kentron sp. LPFa]
MLITFDFGGASLCHEILHFVQKSPYIYPMSSGLSIGGPLTVNGKDVSDAHSGENDRSVHESATGA